MIDEIALRPVGLRHCDIVQEVMRLFGVSLLDLCSDRQNKTIVQARWAIWRCARLHTGLSAPKMGRLLGDRCHTTVLNGIKRSAELYKTCPEFREKCDALDHWAAYAIQDQMQQNNRQ